MYTLYMFYKEGCIFTIHLPVCTKHFCCEKACLPTSNCNRTFGSAKNEHKVDWCNDFALTSS